MQGKACALLRTTGMPLVASYGCLVDEGLSTITVEQERAELEPGAQPISADTEELCVMVISDEREHRFPAREGCSRWECVAGLRDAGAGHDR